MAARGIAAAGLASLLVRGRADDAPENRPSGLLEPAPCAANQAAANQAALRRAEPLSVSRPISLVPL
jgi:hypothetical protein